jgi:hypothetical protein
MIMFPGEEVVCIDARPSQNTSGRSLLVEGVTYIVEGRCMAASLGCARCGGDDLIDLAGGLTGYCSKRFRPRRRWIEEMLDTTATVDDVPPSVLEPA